MAVNLPTALLRSFVAIVDTGSMLSASSRVFLSQSALSLQIKRLEDMVQQELFIREGRGLTLTPAGNNLLVYARKILKMHDQALAAMSDGKFAGPIRIGMIQDFADTLLSGLLSRFIDLHPDVLIFARVARTQELLAQLENRQLDMVIAYGSENHRSAVRDAHMAWYGRPSLLESDVLPLAVLEKPCRFRTAAIDALETAALDYRIAVETPNLSSLRAAVEGGVAIAVRTPLFLGNIEPLTATHLPPLPRTSCILEMAPTPSTAIRHLAKLAEEMLHTL